MVEPSTRPQVNRPRPIRRPRSRVPKTFTCGICGETFTSCAKCTAHTQAHHRPKSTQLRAKSATARLVNSSPMGPGPVTIVNGPGVGSRGRPQTAQERKSATSSRRDFDLSSLKRSLSEVRESRINSSGGRIGSKGVKQAWSSGQQSRAGTAIAKDETPPSNHTGKVYTCYYCQNDFPDPLSLRNHSRVHGGAKPYSCSVCGRLFALYSLLVTHERTHDRQPPHRCHTCGSVFVHEASLRAHQLSHSGSNKPYTCDACGEMLSNEGSLRIHMQRHVQYDVPRVCHVCGTTFSCDAFLKAHSRVHEMEDTTRCVICIKRFRRSRMVLRHSDVLADERQNVCDACQLRFPKVTDGSWRRMRLLLPEDRRFDCVYCGASFTRLHQLAAHETGHKDPDFCASSMRGYLPSVTVV